MPFLPWHFERLQVSMLDGSKRYSFTPHHQNEWSDVLPTSGLEDVSVLLFRRASADT
jgi:hypothetical protein